MIIDVGEGGTFHPRNKQIVANRLVRNALTQRLRDGHPSQSPRYQSMEIKGNKMILTLGDVGQGLYCFDVVNLLALLSAERTRNSFGLRLNSSVRTKWKSGQKELKTRCGPLRLVQTIQFVIFTAKTVR